MWEISVDRVALWPLRHTRKSKSMKAAKAHGFVLRAARN
jgi:hypothetical protein